MKRKTTSRKKRPAKRAHKKPGRVKVYEGRIGPFSVGDAHEKLLAKWAKEDGISEGAIIRELLNREELRRLGHTSVMVTNGKAAETVGARQLV